METAIHAPPPVTAPSSPGVPDAAQLFLILKERLWIIGVCCAAGLVGALVYFKRQPTTFRTHAVIQVEARARVLGPESDPASPLASEAGIPTMLETFRSRPFSERAVRELRLASDPEFCPTPLADAALQGRFRACVHVAQRRGTQLLDIVAEHPTAVVAQRLANGAAESFIQHQIAQRTSGPRALMQFLTSEAQRQKANLQKSEEALQRYKETNRAASLEDRQDTVTSALKIQGGNLAEARTLRIRLESDLAEIERLASDPQALLTIASIAQQTSVAGLRAQIQTLESQLNTLHLRYTDKHPKVIHALQQLADFRTNLRHAVLQAPALARVELERARAAERNFENAFREQEKQALDLNRQSIEFKVLSRDVETDRALYDSILRRLKETDIAKGVQFGDLSLFESAPLPNAPAQRKALQFIALGLFAGLLTGIGAVVATFLLDNTWRSAEEVEISSGLPVLATLPRQSRIGASYALAAALQNPAQPLLEAFRSLRTSLHLSARKHGKKCFLFTSALPADGKSFCAIGYAITLANQGVRTLLVDADMRAPTIEKTLLGTHSKAGLAEVLEGTVPLADAVLSTPIPGLEILSAGSPVAHASELLTRTGIHSTLQSAALAYECIVIDSAPVQSVSDAILLAEAVDCVCMVIHYGRTPRKEALRALHLLQEHGAPLEGIVFNGAHIHRMYDYYNRPRERGSSAPGPTPATPSEPPSSRPQI
jgi:succinoglycan biosynthesis transport protein ExoP